MFSYVCLTRLACSIKVLISEKLGHILTINVSGQLLNKS